MNPTFSAYEYFWHSIRKERSLASSLLWQLVSVHDLAGLDAYPRDYNYQISMEVKNLPDQTGGYKSGTPELFLDIFSPVWEDRFRAYFVGENIAINPPERQLVLPRKDPRLVYSIHRWLGDMHKNHQGICGGLPTDIKSRILDPINSTWERLNEKFPSKQPMLL